MDDDDDGVVFDEGQQAVLLLAVMDFDFPDVVGDFLKEFLGDYRVGIFLEKPYAYRDCLGALVIERVQPFSDRLFSVGGFVELDGGIFFGSNMS